MRPKWRFVWLLAGVYLIALVICIGSGNSFSNQDRDALFAGSSIKHMAGTDALGRDRAVRVSAALLLSLTGSGAAALISTGIAAILGVGAAFVNRRVTAVLFFLADVFLALPWLFLLMLVRATMPLNTPGWQSAGITFLLLAALGWPACMRALHKCATNLRDSEWVLQGRASGLRPWQLIRYVIPNLRPILLVQFIVSVPAFIMAESNLGSIGLGIGEPVPSWGGMLQDLDNSSVLLRSYWGLLPILILVIVLLLMENIGREENLRA
jgi:peptide/nickel transport system permease protein